jgi:hypothetical protein
MRESVVEIKKKDGVFYPEKRKAIEKLDNEKTNS